MKVKRILEGRGRKSAAALVVGALSMLGVMLAGTPSVAAVNCTFSAGAVTVTMSAGNDSGTLLRSPTDEILVNGVACGDATVANTNGISVTGANGTQDLTIDLTGGHFAPGAMAESGEESEIELTIGLLGGNDSLTITGSSGDDLVKFGALGLAFTGDSDLDATLAGVETFAVNAGDGDDTAGGQGGNGTGTAFTSGKLTINGGDGADNLSGGDFSSGGAPHDVISGDDGADTISGGAGKDTLNGGLGNDVSISGDAGDDTINGNEGDDVLNGGADKDTMYGNLGNDELNGDAADDTMYGDNATDDLVNDGDDELNGGIGKDTMAGDAGDDDLNGGDDNDTANGEAGDDELDGGAGTDTVSGGTEDDVLAGGAGNDTLSGGTEDDVLAGGAGNDTLSGGTDVAGTDKDTLDYSYESDPVTVDLSLPLPSAVVDHAPVGPGSENENDNISAGDFENVRGGSSNDSITGDGNDNELSGNAGDDEFVGAAGDDTLSGGAGNDTADYSGATDSMDVDLTSLAATKDGEGDSDTFADDGFGNSDVENVVGSDDDDTITGDAGDNHLSGNKGDDTIAGLGEASAATDVLSGGDGIDTLDYSASLAGVTVDLDADTTSGGDAAADDISSDDFENVIGSDFDDSLTGDAGDNDLSGGDGDDDLSGKAEDDKLFGGDGDDSIAGNAGHDLVSGDAGADEMGGGLDRDTLSYASDATGADITVDLSQTPQSASGAGSDAAGDVLTGKFENVVTADGDDTLIGDDGDNILIAAGGNDALAGGLGNDKEMGGAGDDTFDQGSVPNGGDQMFGGDGSDTASYLHRTTAVNMSAEGDSTLSVEKTLLPNGSAATVPAGGTASTGDVSQPAGQTNPVVTAVTSPTGGTVTITENTTPTVTAPRRFSFLGVEVVIVAPDAITVDDPLRLTFVLDSSVLEGQSKESIQIFRTEGSGSPTLVGECPGSNMASPDPCVTAREDVTDGDVRITVLTSKASTWNFATQSTGGNGSGGGGSLPSPSPSASPSPSPSPSPSEEPSPSPSPSPDDDVLGQLFVDSVVTIRYVEKTDTFKGKVDSNRPRCESGREVKLLKRRPGRDRVVDKLTTNAFGKWRDPGYLDPHGRYYARVTGASFITATDLEVICQRDRSRTLRLRRAM